MEENKSELIDIKGILREFSAKWHWFLISVVCSCAVGFLVSKIVKPQYEIRANVILTENNALGSMMAAGGLSGVSALLGGNASAEDEVEIMTSHSVLKEVARTLGLNEIRFDRPAPLMATMLYKNYPIDVVPAPEILADTMRVGLQFRIVVHKNGLADISVKARKKTIYNEKDKSLPCVVNLPYGDFTVVTTPNYVKGKKIKNLINFTNYDVAAENLRKQIAVALATKRSQIITMQMITDNEPYACDVLNTLIEKYNARGLRDHLAQTGATADFLRDRLLMMRHELDSTETALARYKTSEGITELEKDGAVIYQRMIEAEKELAEQQVLTQLARVTLTQVRNSAHDNSLIPQQSADPILAAQIDAYNGAIMARLRMEQSAKGDNPSIVRVDEQIKTLRSNLISTLEAAVSKGEQMTAEYRKVYDEASAQVSGLPKQELSYRSKVRDQTIQEEIYLFLLQKQEETAILMNNTLPKGAIVDEAYSLNEDKSLSTKVLLALFFAVGLCIPPAFIYGKKLLGKK
ncbi:MAG: hypothetical protein K2O38_04855 [Muribaculaceae bacterium]|nr:hypothetical protein [Muribaculaceae bacterium]